MKPFLARTAGFSSLHRSDRIFRANARQTGSLCFALPSGLPTPFWTNPFGPNSVLCLAKRGFAQSLPATPGARATGDVG